MPSAEIAGAAAPLGQMLWSAAVASVWLYGELLGHCSRAHRKQRVHATLLLHPGILTPMLGDWLFILVGLTLRRILPAAPASIG